MASPFPLVYIAGLVQPVVSPLDDGLSPLSNIVESAWEISTRVSSFSAISWNIPQEGISTSVAISWNADARILATQSFVTLGLPAPVVRPMDQNYLIPGSAWNVDKRSASVSQSSSWRVINRILGRKPVNWNVLDTEVSRVSSSFNTLLRIYKPGVTLEEFPAAINQPVVHAIDYNQFLPSPTSTWNMNLRKTALQPARWNTFLVTRTQIPIAFNTNGILVSPQIASSWILRSPVVSERQSTWGLDYRLPLKIASSWEVEDRVTIRQSTSWRVFNKVSPQVTSAWALTLRIPRLGKSSWQYLETIRDQRLITWNVLLRTVVKDWQLVSNSPGGISTSVVHPIDIGTPALARTPNYGLPAPVVYPLDESFYSGYGYSPLPGISWRLGVNPVGRVTSQIAVSWNTLLIAGPKVVSSWSLDGRTSVLLPLRFNVLNNSVQQAIIQWNVGRPLQGVLRQTAVDRTDWAM